LAKAEEFGLDCKVREDPRDWQKLAKFPKGVTAPDGVTVVAMVHMYKADPERGENVPTFVKWLGKALPEDLPDFTKAVTRHKLENARRGKLEQPLLPPIASFATMADLAKELPADPRDLEKRRLYEKEAVKTGEAKLLWQNGPDEVLYSVPTMKVAQQLGRGAWWCTARHAFPSYSDDLLYLRRGGEVYQLHFGSLQFKNRKEEDVPLKDIMANAPGLGAALAPMVIRAIEKKGSSYGSYQLGKIITEVWESDNEELQNAVKPTALRYLVAPISYAALTGEAYTALDMLSVCWETKDAQLRNRIKANTLKNLGTILSATVHSGREKIAAELLEGIAETGDIEFIKSARKKARPYVNRLFIGSAFERLSKLSVAAMASPIPQLASPPFRP
jgi:hypothetical protein